MQKRDPMHELEQMTMLSTLRTALGNAVLEAMDGMETEVILGELDWLRDLVTSHKLETGIPGERAVYG